MAGLARDRRSENLYVLVAGIFVEGIFITIPRYNHIREVAMNTDPAAAGEAIERLVRDPRHVALVALVTVLWLAIVYVMVVKPTLSDGRGVTRTAECHRQRDGGSYAATMRRSVLRVGSSAGE